MTRAIPAILVLALVPGLGQAQSSNYSKWHGYGYIAPGGLVANTGSRAAVHLGLGAERFFNRFVGVGAELGWLRIVGGGCCNPSWGTLSSNFVARFPGKFEPFGTVGYSLMVRNEADGGVNFGAGFNWWFDKRVALRIEGRDHLVPEYFHTLGLRIGLTVR